ncbi:MAG: methyltransferase domain-containing protein [Gammaproteobacteria bacterium]|jgi:SAM-dependent methyltransferase|nr:methyltransferase domain-containing protein [Gammaproteobacteria bacterium]NBP08514.1 methyltransferase domain-containing protein [Gammaproteobacteria bacterium]NBR18408.1 methyltransferase domain-containing protein [Gammaproteobacteria bacterium]NDA44001.1 methyltransferase domain-containing protein [Gammaproteobacteria bacterium]NDB25876.1 methyltransferase domain-containing protein [Gammaproteobacteria bacterium]
MTSALAEWFSGPRGAALLALESALVGETLEDCFGWEMLQVGAWGEGRGLLRGARTRSQALAASSLVSGCDLVSRLSQLPIASDSVDTVLLPHTLEFESDPYSVLREADRVLAGDGKLVILAFAPWSPWGLRAATTRAGYPPGLRRLISERRLRDWLRLLGYDIGEARRYLHELPWGEPAAVTLRTRRSWWYPLPGGAVVLKARKRLHSLTPLRPRLRERATRVLGGLTEPSSANRRPP